MRGLRNKCLNQIIALVASTALLLLPMQGRAQIVDEDPSAIEMTFDGLVVRPVTLVATVLGAGVWLVTLPFSLLGGNAGDAADNLILYPAKATFVRCLGCKQLGRKVDYADELEDLEEDSYDEDFEEPRDEATKADEDPYAVEESEDFTADLDAPADDQSTLSYDTGEEDLGAGEDDGFGFGEDEGEYTGDIEGFSDEEIDETISDGGEEDDIEDYGF